MLGYWKNFNLDASYADVGGNGANSIVEAHTIDCRGMDKISIMVTNNHGSANLLYKVFGCARAELKAKELDIGDAENITTTMSDEAEPTHWAELLAEQTVAAGAEDAQTLTHLATFIRILVKGSAEILATQYSVQAVGGARL